MLTNAFHKLGKEQLQQLLDESNSYADLFNKLGMSVSGDAYKILRKTINDLNIDITKVTENRMIANKNLFNRLHKKQKIPTEKILFSGDDIKIDSKVLKKRLFGEGYKERICENCGLTEWLGEEIPLQIHHIDGNHNNNNLYNIQILCPNCHALTDNFAGKNINKGNKTSKAKIICPVCGKNQMWAVSKMCKECYDKSKYQNMVTREELKSKIRNTSFEEIGREFNRTGNTIKKWCKRFGLPSKRSEIEKINDEDWISI